MHPSDQKFMESKLPGRKLDIALERLFQNHDGTLSPQWQKTYESYVKTRIYPALQILTKRRDIPCLERLLQTGWAGEDLCLRLLREEPVRDIQIRAMLLTRKPADMATAIPSDIAQTGSADTKPDAYINASPQVLIRHLFSLWRLRLGTEIPSLRTVLASMTLQEVQDEQNPGTNGEVIFYHRERFLRILESENGYRTYLHIILHCLFFHIIPPRTTDHNLWDLACDCAAEILAGQMFPGIFPDCSTRLRTLLQVDALFPLTSAASILHHLETRPELSASLREMSGRDSHRAWYMPTGQKRPETDRTSTLLCSAPSPSIRSVSLPCRSAILEQWRRTAQSVPGSTPPTTSHFGPRPGSRQDRMEKREQGQYRFGPYLKRFSVTREEMQTDPDSFDYIPYHYGIALYGNLPFLEPLEYTEAYKVEELAIAIDTSGSCSVPVVRRFLGETRKMLMEKEHFFTRMRVHVFQCDSMIQKYNLIHSRKEWNHYEETLSIAGRGGTNFTPVFTQIQHMQADGSIKKLKGLLYFTDGDGVYPSEKPPYETAFIFPDFRFLDYRIPKWITRLCLQERGKTP